jgi:hypothetical protein
MTTSAWTSSRRSGPGIIRSYAADLTGWARGIATRYAVAVVVLLVGAIAVLVAVGFGIAALFRFIELHYGVEIAFWTLGGFFAVIGLIGVIAGIALLKRQLPRVPRPDRQIGDLKRSVATSAALRLLPTDRNAIALTKDPVMRILIGTAAALAIGWIAAAGRSRRRDVDRREA